MRWMFMAVGGTILATPVLAADEPETLLANKPMSASYRALQAAPPGAPSTTVTMRCLAGKDRFSRCETISQAFAPRADVAAAAEKLGLAARFEAKDRNGRAIAGRSFLFETELLAPGDKNPDWLRQPTNDEMTSAMPTKALKERKDGSAVIFCRITVEGFLDRCSVVEENPEGYGFGAAALHLSKSFAMTPKVRGGRPVEGGTARIPINWRGIAGGGYQTTRHRVVSDPTWTKTPSAAVVKAAYPERATRVPDGQAVVRCEFDDQGATRSCEALSEAPRGLGFGAAARKLAEGGFAVQLTPEDMKTLKAFSVDIPFRFRNPSGEAGGRLTDVRWTSTLSPQGAALLFPRAAVEKRIKTGVGVVDCAATASGELTDCRTQREDPPALGFGDAALQAAKAMRMNPWTKGGDAVEGRRILLPIRLSVETLPEEAAAQAAPPPP